MEESESPVQKPKRLKTEIEENGTDAASPKSVVVNGYSVPIPNRKRTRSVSLSEEHDPVAQKGKLSNFRIADGTVEKLKGQPPLSELFVRKKYHHHLPFCG